MICTHTRGVRLANQIVQISHHHVPLAKKKQFICFNFQLNGTHICQSNAIHIELHCISNYSFDSWSSLSVHSKIVLRSYIPHCLCLNMHAYLHVSMHGVSSDIYRRHMPRTCKSYVYSVAPPQLEAVYFKFPSNGLVLHETGSSNGTPGLRLCKCFSQLLHKNRAALIQPSSQKAVHPYLQLARMILKLLTAKCSYLGRRWATNSGPEFK